ncbi:MAG: glycosyltransferase, partial [Terrimicrobiaceae bacterium]
GEIPNLIGKSNGGLVFPERDPVEFAKALRQILTDKDLRQKLGEDGRKWVEREVSLSAVAKKMADTFENVTGSEAKQSDS